MRTLLSGVCALLLMLMSGSARAQNAFSFDKVKALARQENPVVQAHQASLRVTEALITQASVTPTLSKPPRHCWVTWP